MANIQPDIEKLADLNGLRKAAILLLSMDSDTSSRVLQLLPRPLLEEVMREILETVLGSEGYRVKLAATGKEGRDIAAREPIDLAIIDVMLPDGSGIDGQRPRS